MDTSSLQAVSQWVIANGYALMFVLMIIEGPVVTAAGAFAAALQIFNIWLVLVLSLLGNLIPDALYYILGFWGRKRLLERFGHYFGAKKEWLEKLESKYAEHAGKTLMAVKLIPALATPGLIVAGIARVPLKKYIWWSLIVTIPSSLFYLIVGYYFGEVYNQISRYVKYGEYLIVIFIIIFVILSYAGKKISRKISGKIEEI